MFAVAESFGQDKQRHKSFVEDLIARCRMVDEEWTIYARKTFGAYTLAASSVPRGRHVHVGQSRKHAQIEYQPACRIPTVDAWAPLVRTETSSEECQSATCVVIL